MKNAVEYLIEPLLTQFFLMDAICRGFIDDDQRYQMFRDLAEVFCVPMNRQTEEYFRVANSSQYKDIADYAAYERLCRTIEFAQTSGQDVGLSPIDRVILAQKREAMQSKADIFKQSKNLTADIIADTLLDTAMNGNVDAMVTLAYMEYHGLCICKDTGDALKRLKLCAKWNHLFGNLMGIAYDKRSKADYYNTLYTILRSSNQREVFKYICQHTAYKKTCVRKPEARIIEKAFGLGIIKRNRYDQIFAKVAFSELICAEDKEKLLLNKQEEAIVSLSVIPFDAQRTTAFSFDRAKAEKIPLNRSRELHEVLCSISPATNNHTELYRPLLVAGDDDYLSQMYMSALKQGFSKSNKVIEVDAGTLTMLDFSGAKENFILRGLSETKQTHTVFLVQHCDEMGDRELEELMKLLDYGYRRKFKLLEPTVSIDLSDVLIVLFASQTNSQVRRLAQECDVVWTDRISEAEKQTVIESMFKTRSKSFGIGRIKLEADCKTYLASFKTGQIIRIIDGALKRAAYDREPVITAAALKTVSEQQNIGRGKGEFGYLRGAYNEEY